MKTDMKRLKEQTYSAAKNRLLLFTFMFILFGSISVVHPQEIRWLRISELQSFINEIGAVYEHELSSGNTNFFSWPAAYSIDQNTIRMRGLWMGCENFDDPVEGKTKSVKVIASGPRYATDVYNQIFPVDIKLVGKYNAPTVLVDGVQAAIISDYDEVDSLDEDMAADRKVIVKFNTSIGLSVDKEVSVFSNPNHGNYHINDYIFTNTGIYDEDGSVKEQTLEELWIYFIYRHALAGVTSTEYGSTWGAYESTWGESNIIHSFEYGSGEENANDMRGFYVWYGPSTNRNVTYDEDWGCPNILEDGTLGSAKYAGCVTLHVDTSPDDTTDDLSQPATTWFISPDLDLMAAGIGQYNETLMSERYDVMSEGHPDVQHDVLVGDDYPYNYTDPVRQKGGGVGEGQGFGPYTLEPGESIRIVFAEAVNGISWEKGREVGAKWIQWYNGTAQPELVLPDGSTTTDHNNYKKEWVYTGRDSIIQTYRNAMDNFGSGYTIPSAPPPPEEFSVTSGGDRILLEWSDNAESDPNFDGYVIYRSVGTVMDYTTEYEKIFECDASGAVNTFDDVTASRGFDYYYYIQSKDDGTQNEVNSGVPLTSSKFWTMTNVAANLQRPAVTSTLDSVRVVPNPYDIRSRMFQFGTESQYDQIAFYGLPPECKLKIFTERGDLIWEKDHTNQTGDETWDSITSSGQIVASGIYILYVETPKGEKVIRKFVVIR